MEFLALGPGGFDKEKNPKSTFLRAKGTFEGIKSIEAEDMLAYFFLYMANVSENPLHT